MIPRALRWATVLAVATILTVLVRLTRQESRGARRLSGASTPWPPVPMPLDGPAEP